ncbi:MAG: radical SAM protein [Candidatus Omnitrophota bacterium]
MRPSILFVYPELIDFNFLEPVFSHHLGVGYILGYLRQKGIQASQFIYQEPLSLRGLTSRILKQNPKIVGFTCDDANYYFTKIISLNLKRENPNLIILFGGPTATFSDEMIMRDNPAIDICVRGEGEITTYELIKHLQSGSDINNIPGITYRFGSKLVRTADRPLINSGIKGKELDILPSPYLNNLLPLDGSYGILTARGCVFRCVYCNYSAMSRWTIRYHSEERIIAELKAMQDNFERENRDVEDRWVPIYDDNFTLNMERSKRLCRIIIEERINLRFWTNTRADRVDRELLLLMKQSGFESLNFGLESAVPRVLRNIRKLRASLKLLQKDNLALEKQFVEKVKTSVRLAKKVGLKPTVSIILGLPGATIEDDKKTIEFVRKLKVEAYAHDFLVIYAGTELFDTYKKFGLKIKSNPALLPFYTEHSYDVYKIPEMNNSIATLYEIVRLEKAMRLITGEYADREHCGYPNIIFNNQKVTEKRIRWLERIIFLGPIILFEKNNFNKTIDRKNIDLLISAGLPITTIFFLAPLNNKSHNSFYSGSASDRYQIGYFKMMMTNKRGPFPTLLSLECCSFADYRQNSLIFPQKTGGVAKKVVFYLHNSKSVDMLTELFSSPNKLVLEGMLAKQDCFFMDECRWSSRDCPAVKFLRAIVGRDDKIRPCSNGGTIAKVGEESLEIIKRLRLRWRDEKKKRGCKKCPVRKSCSKCLFPYPMDTKEYCRVRRKAANIDKIFQILEALRKLRVDEPQTLLNLRSDKILCTFNDDLAIINIDKRKYIYSFSMGELFGQKRQKAVLV